MYSVSPIFGLTFFGKYCNNPVKVPTNFNMICQHFDKLSKVKFPFSLMAGPYFHKILKEIFLLVLFFHQKSYILYHSAFLICILKNYIKKTRFFSSKISRNAGI